MNGAASGKMPRLGVRWAQAAPGLGPQTVVFGRWPGEGSSQTDVLGCLLDPPNSLTPHGPRRALPPAQGAPLWRSENVSTGAGLTDKHRPELGPGSAPASRRPLSPASAHGCGQLRASHCQPGLSWAEPEAQTPALLGPVFFFNFILWNNFRITDKLQRWNRESPFAQLPPT